MQPILRPRILIPTTAFLALCYFTIRPQGQVFVSWNGSSSSLANVQNLPPDQEPVLASQEPEPEPESSVCSPSQWSSGSWERKPNPIVFQNRDDVYRASGFLGCASNREVGWHLANDHPEEFWWRGNVSAYEWVPSGRACRSVPDDYQEALVVELVEKGGWLLIGDSVTQEHYFSLSCTLYPHVLATPDYSKGGHPDRTWPHHLYLNPKSDIVSRIKFPRGFDVAKTPLVTFRRNDLLFNHDEIETIFNSGPKPHSGNSTLFGKEASFTLSPLEYLDDLFFRPLPDANYRTLIVSTAGHWSLKLFAGLSNGYADIYDLFRLATHSFVYQAARQLDLHEKRDGKQREVVVRPYLAGHDKCHARDIVDAGPLKVLPDIQRASYNWAWIPHMNELFRQAVEQAGHPYVNYAGIDRPGRLRPDAHALSDCLHLIVGTGIIEGWTKYLHYFTATYLPWHREQSDPRYPISDKPFGYPHKSGRPSQKGSHLS